MMAKLRNMLFFASTLAGAALGAGNAALALTFEDIAGKWCGATLSYAFAPDMLTVILTSERTPRQYKVEYYQYTDTEITVNWLRENKKRYTRFSQFSADDTLMVQLQNAEGPQREFKRCP